MHVRPMAVKRQSFSSESSPSCCFDAWCVAGVGARGCVFLHCCGGLAQARHQQGAFRLPRRQVSEAAPGGETPYFTVLAYVKVEPWQLNQGAARGGSR